jgi:hypothetical protein
MKAKDVQTAFEQLNKKYLSALREIDRLHDLLDESKTPAQKEPGDYRNAARLLANSEWNKEDLSEQDIYDMLIKMSEDEVRKKIGFWAMPLPKDQTRSTNTTYTTKSR